MRQQAPATLLEDGKGLVGSCLVWLYRSVELLSVGDPSFRVWIHHTSGTISIAFIPLRCAEGSNTGQARETWTVLHDD